jgi:hypothetical protein
MDSAMTTTLTSLVLLAAALVPAAPGEDALPGRDGNYELEPNSVVGTVWKGKLGSQVWIIRFQRGGTLSYTLDRFGARDVSWKQQGNVVTMRANNGNSEFRLVIEGQRLRGEGHNLAGEHWQLDMKYTGTIKKPWK